MFNFARNRHVTDVARIGVGRESRRQDVKNERGNRPKQPRGRDKPRGGTSPSYGRARAKIERTSGVLPKNYPHGPLQNEPLALQRRACGFALQNPGASGQTGGAKKEGPRQFATGLSASPVPHRLAVGRQIHLDIRKVDA
jgi:hypothetical protein